MNPIRLAKTVTRAVARRLGFDIQPTVNSARATLGGGLRRLAAVGLEPATGVDVGAADGTRELYSAFPSAKRLLLKPLGEHLPALKELVRTLPGAEYFPEFRGEPLTQIDVYLSMLTDTTGMTGRPQPGVRG